MGSKVYLVITEDRHVDIDVEPFQVVDDALAFAKEQVQELARHPESIREQSIKGRIYYCQYSTEGDSISIIEKVIR